MTQKYIIDILELGQIVRADFYADSRAPFDGSVASTPWDSVTSYNPNDLVIYQGFSYSCILANTNQNPFTDTSSRTVEFGTYWKAIDGKDGDVWVRVSGANSDFYQKSNNAWSSLTSGFSGAPIVLGDSQTGSLAISYDKTAYPSAIIDYFMSAPGGSIERGSFTIVNDGTDANGTQWGISSIGTALGIDFFFGVSGSDVQITYDSSATPTGRSLLYIIRR